MDYKRLFFIAGLVISGYLLLLQWSDFTSKPVADTTAQTSQQLPAPTLDDNDLPPLAANADPNVDQSELPRLDAASSSRPAQTSTTAASDMISVSTDTFNLRINPRGGDIEFLSLPKFPISLNNPDDPFVMLDTQSMTYVAQSGLVGNNQGQRPLFTSSSNQYRMQPGQPLEVVLTHEQADQVRIDKIFRFTPGSHAVDVEHRVTNLSQENQRFAQFGQIKRDGSPDPSSSGGFGLQSFVGFALSTDRNNYNKISFRKIRGNDIDEASRGGWIALMQHYFISAWIPGPDQQNQFYALPTNDGMYRGGFVGPSFELAPGQQERVAATFYSGPKDQPSLREIAPNLNLTVDYGWLFWIAQPLFWVLTFFQGFVGNWGLAIILLTFSVKALFFYPSAKAYRSMAKMRALAPKLQSLKEQIGDDRQKMGQEMMKLYKKEGVNPLGGCLPILIQMPVFIALYWVLMESVELRQSPFIFWIADLSIRDPFFILPILMGVSQYVQMQLGTKPQDPMQQKIFAMMPIIFTFMFMWFPAGLVLYWLTNNLLSIAQQWYINRTVKGAS